MFAVDQYAIDAAGGVRPLFTGQIVAGGENDAPLLGGGDAGGGAAETAALALADFDEDQRVAVATDEVDFSAAAVVIARDDAQALAGKEYGGGLLGAPTFIDALLGRSVAGRGIGAIVIAHCTVAANNEMVMTENSPALYVVPTPLGNLGDMTQRAIEVLRSVPWVAAEDTRHSAPLLRHFGVTARLLAAHEHNEEAAAQQIIARLAAGESVALVSDAGTPAVSDPGARLVARVRAAGFRVVPLPGACAAVTALSAAGIEAPHFLFYGFLPAKAAQRERALRELAGLPFALVFYEAPHRILASVAALAQALGGRRTLVIARELTKVFETIHVGPLADGLAWLEADPDRQRGEFVLIVSGAPASDGDDEEGARVLRLLLADGLPVRQAVDLARAITGAGRKTLYGLALSMAQAKDSPVEAETETESESESGEPDGR